MASSISKFFSALRIARSVSILSVFLQIPTFARADLQSTSIKKRNISTGSSIPTAIADTANAEVSRAGEVTLRLRGIAHGGGQVEFRLEQKPVHGKIVRYKAFGLDCLDVVYRHSGDMSSDADTFVFAVRSGGMGPFSPGLAKIRIVDQPGRLLLPESLAFPATLVGQTAIDNFVAVNEGGETLSGKISVTPPWHLEGPASYQLKPRGKRKITLLFRPTTEGVANGRLRFEGSQSASIELSGQGLGTFQASPAKLRLTPTLDGKRSSIVSLQNNIDQNITIELTSSLTVPKSVTLQFGETREIVVEDSGTDRLQGYITFKSGTYETRIEVSADKTPNATP